MALLWNLVGGWWCFGISERCFEMDGGVSKWMVVFRCFERCFGKVFRSGWWCFGVSKQCFEVDGGVSKWMVVFRYFGQKCFENSQKWMVVWMVVFRYFQTVF